MSVNVKLPSIEKYITAIPSGKMQKLLAQAAIGIVQQHLLDSYEMGVGGNDKTLQSPKGNESYLRYKAKESGRGLIDMRGARKDDNMLDQLGIVRQKPDTVWVGFKSTTAQEKARYNYKRRPQFFKIADRIKNEVVEYVSNYLTK